MTKSTNKRHRAKRQVPKVIRMRLTYYQINKVADIVRSNLKTGAKFRVHQIAGDIIGVKDTRYINGDTLFAGLRGKGLFQCIGCQCWKELHDESKPDSEICRGCEHIVIGGEG